MNCVEEKATVRIGAPLDLEKNTLQPENEVRACATMFPSLELAEEPRFPLKGFGGGDCGASVNQQDVGLLARLRVVAAVARHCGQIRRGQCFNEDSPCKKRIGDAHQVALVNDGIQQLPGRSGGLGVLAVLLDDRLESVDQCSSYVSHLLVVKMVGIRRDFFVQVDQELVDGPGGMLRWWNSRRQELLVVEAASDVVARDCGPELLGGLFLNWSRGL